MNHRLFIGIAASLTALILSALPALADPVVHTDKGDVVGATKAPGVESFLGIPFAAPPIGDLRWRAPQPAAPWSSVRPAMAFSKDCIQEPQAYAPGPGFNNPASEDCLYLNVWRPAGKPSKPLPVMVWIYGGAWIMGAGSFPSYDGTEFARDGVILVNFNYRLGRFGVFAHPALSREQAGQPLANYGLMDQIAALKWVQANIAAFGGDPANVTIFGESAGAASVNLLMTSPLAHGLFAKGISESGPAHSGMQSLEDAETAGKAWADKMHAPDLAALRALPADKVWDGPATVPASPVVDGKVVVASTDQAFANGLAAAIPYIGGSNGREESLIRWLPGADEHWFARLGAKGPDLLALYTADGTSPKTALGKLWGEAAMAAPARARARAAAAKSDKTWLYRYAYVPDAAQGSVPGAGHDAEMEMVFKNPDMRWTGKWSDADRAMARSMNAYWVNFAKTGNPNGPGLPAWPAYTPESDMLMNFDRPGPAPVAAFGKMRLDAIEAAQAGAL
jgi:para-nitrobenzyl esterase